MGGGLDLMLAARLASIAARIVVGKLGTAVADAGEIAEILGARRERGSEGES